MNKTFLSDFLLGKRLNSESEFFATFPSLINDLKDIEINKDSFGNFVFSNINESNKIITQLASSDVGIGNFILILKKWINSPDTYVIKGKSEFISEKDFCGYLRHDLLEVEGSYVQDSFLRISKEDNIICYVGFNSKMELFFYRGHYQFVNIPSYVHDILKIINCSGFDKKQDKVKKKYNHKFSDSVYFYCNHKKTQKS